MTVVARGGAEGGPEVRGRAPTGTYSPSRAVPTAGGVLLTVSGQLGVADGDERVPPVAVQAARAHRRVEDELAAWDAGPQHVVALRVFLLDIGDLAAVEATRAHWPGPPPASTALAVVALAHPDALVEVEAMAFVPDTERFEIRKTFAFSASHALAGLEPDHPCGRLHGHNYVIELVLAAPAVDGRGFVVDYGELAPFGRYVDRHLDHRHLNDVLDVNPSAENIAAHVYRWSRAHLDDPVASRLVAVRVSETPKTWAEYRPGSDR